MDSEQLRKLVDESKADYRKRLLSALGDTYAGWEVRVHDPEGQHRYLTIAPPAARYESRQSQRLKFVPGGQDGVGSAGELFGVAFVPEAEFKRARPILAEICREWRSLRFTI